MWRVLRTFPFGQPIAVGDCVDISDLPDRDLLAANGYVEEIKPEAAPEKDAESVVKPKPADPVLKSEKKKSDSTKAKKPPAKSAKTKK